MMVRGGPLLPPNHAGVYNDDYIYIYVFEIGKKKEKHPFLLKETY
jgi:hypothetical protein